MPSSAQHYAADANQEQRRQPAAAGGIGVRHHFGLRELAKHCAALNQQRGAEHDR